MAPASSTAFDALWWGVSTLTTVGYRDTVPVTAEGRLAAMVPMLLGIVLFSAITPNGRRVCVGQIRPDPRWNDPGLEALGKAPLIRHAKPAGAGH